MTTPDTDRHGSPLAFLDDLSSGELDEIASGRPPSAMSDDEPTAEIHPPGESLQSLQRETMELWQLGGTSAPDEALPPAAKRSATPPGLAAGRTDLQFAARSPVPGATEQLVFPPPGIRPSRLGVDTGVFEMGTERLVQSELAPGMRDPRPQVGVLRGSMPAPDREISAATTQEFIVPPVQVRAPANRNLPPGPLAQPPSEDEHEGWYVQTGQEPPVDSRYADPHYDDWDPEKTFQTASLLTRKVRNLIMGIAGAALIVTGVTASIRSLFSTGSLEQKNRPAATRTAPIPSAADLGTTSNTANSGSPNSPGNVAASVSDAILDCYTIVDSEGGHVRCDPPTAGGGHGILKDVRLVPVTDPVGKITGYRIVLGLNGSPLISKEILDKSAFAEEKDQEEHFIGATTFEKNPASGGE